jgi:hypothetical protein
MTKEELIQKLKDLGQSHDEEDAHLQADKALLRYINDKEISKLFWEIPKWYA